MTRTTRRALCASAVLAAVLAGPGVARADVIADWNLIAQNEAILIRPTAHGQARGMAMVQGAVYDAVNAINRAHQPYLLDLRDLRDLGVQPFASHDAAVATAAHHVLVAIVAPERRPVLDAALETTLAGILDGAIETDGIKAGEAAAAAMLAARQNDGFMAPFAPTIGPDPGVWRPIGWPAAPAFDPDGWVGNLKPFVLESPSQFRSKGPNALTSTAYAKDYDEVRSVGALNSGTRTADQTTAAIFWQFAPAVFYNRLARDLAGSGRFGLDTVKQARLYAMVNLAMADGATACWNDKYHWNFWRPRAAIREGDTDGNQATLGDPAWESLFHPSTGAGLATPPFPDHPSGHGCLSGAVFRAFREFFGRDKVAFDMHSGRFPGKPRHFDSFSDALEEIVDARVWGGIHFRTADVQGAVIGKKVGHWLAKHYFRPLLLRG